MKEQILNEIMGVYALNLNDTIGLFQSNNFGLFFLFKDPLTAERAIVRLGSWNEVKISIHQKHDKIVKLTLHDNESIYYELHLEIDSPQVELASKFIQCVRPDMYFPLGACILRDNEIIQAPESLVIQVKGYKIVKE